MKNTLFFVPEKDCSVGACLVGPLIVSIIESWVHVVVIVIHIKCWCCACCGPWKGEFFIFFFYLSHDARKVVFRVSDQICHKPAHTVTEAGNKPNISDLERRDIVLYKGQKQR